MAIIKSGDSTDQLTVDPTSKAARVTMYKSDGTEITDHVPLAVAVNPVTVVSNDIIASFDVSTYKFISLQLTGIWVGTVSFQGSNDNGTFDEVVSQDMGEQTSPYVSDTTTTGIYKIPTAFQYLRVRVTAYTSGTVEGFALAYKEDSNTGQISATGQVGLNAGTAYIGDVKVLPTISAPSISHKVISAVGVNATLLQVGASNIDMLLMVSGAATPRFVKFYDQATIPVVGTDIPKYTFPLAVGASPLQLPPKGLNFTTGLAYAILLSVEDAGTTPFTVVGEVVAMLDYT